ncbi:transcriptional regulator [Asticcacaulis sp. AC402]|uniref:winged helix-turn-helix domain-containing protein n=1 Tax=Asticcacaulis sp. AC402 TaxID=1282361 RepID=UPI0003FBD3FB
MPGIDANGVLDQVAFNVLQLAQVTGLIQHPGKVLTHAQLLNAVWGRRSTEQNHYLRIHTQHLREKLKDDPLRPRFILTEPGIGYRFSD